MKKEKGKSFNDLPLVRAWGLEPQRITAREPKSRMSTNSIMPAYLIFQITHRAGNEKTFSVVTEPKSRMSTNSIMPAGMNAVYHILRP